MKWATPKAEELLRESGIHTESKYIVRRQGAVAQWVVLRPMFEVYDWEKGFEGWKQKRKLWCKKEVTDEALRAKLEEASREAQIWKKRWEKSKGAT